MNGYNLPPYRCTECGKGPWLMVDETTNGAHIGVGCECTVETGKPFKMLGGNPITMPDRWVIQRD